MFVTMKTRMVYVINYPSVRGDEDDLTDIALGRNFKA